MLAKIDIIAAQTSADAERFIQLGAKVTGVRVVGSMKFDIEISPEVHQSGQVFRQLWGENRLIWLAASTHEGEELIILDAFEIVKRCLPDVLLVLVPRHPERFNKVADLCQARAYQLIRRSEHQPCIAETDIFLGDTMGELLPQYAACDLAFVGGSFVPIGGHNILEPAACGKVSIIGPYFENIEEMSACFKAVQALYCVNDTKALAKHVISLLENVDTRTYAGKCALQVLEENKGAVGKHLELINALLVKQV
jgi:3-deoxy-D-manno-octulosonic-acid transferase